MLRNQKRQMHAPNQCVFNTFSQCGRIHKYDQSAAVTPVCSGKPPLLEQRQEMSVEQGHLCSLSQPDRLFDKGLALL